MNDFFVAGIDGGQSSTTAVVGNAAGEVVGRATGGPADEIAAGPRSTRLRDALSDALEGALMQAGLAAATEFAAIVAGISGYEGALRGRPPELPTHRLELMHDAPIAHAGALAGDAGVTVLSGTGSVVYATGDGPDRTYGGWGYLFGDEGSAFWLARATIAQLMRRSDDGEAHDDDVRAVCGFFGLSSLREVAATFHSGGISRARLASFCPTALRLSPADRLTRQAARRFSEVVNRAIACGSPPVVALTGGTFADAPFRTRVAAEIERTTPGVVVAQTQYEPGIGALLLAYRCAGRRFCGDRGRRGDA